MARTLPVKEVNEDQQGSINAVQQFNLTDLPEFDEFDTSLVKSQILQASLKGQDITKQKAAEIKALIRGGVSENPDLKPATDAAEKRIDRLVAALFFVGPSPL